MILEYVILDEFVGERHDVLVSLLLVTIAKFSDALYVDQPLVWRAVITVIVSNALRTTKLKKKWQALPPWCFDSSFLNWTDSNCWHEGQGIILSLLFSEDMSLKHHSEDESKNKKKENLKNISTLVSNWD